MLRVVPLALGQKSLAMLRSIASLDGSDCCRMGLAVPAFIIPLFLGSSSLPLAASGGLVGFRIGTVVRLLVGRLARAAPVRPAVLRVPVGVEALQGQIAIASATDLRPHSLPLSRSRNLHGPRADRRQP